MRTINLNLPSVELNFRVNGRSPVEHAAAAYNRGVHTFYDTPREFAADFADAVGERRDMTEREVADLRRRIAVAIAPESALVYPDES